MKGGGGKEGFGVVWLFPFWGGGSPIQGRQLGAVGAGGLLGGHDEDGVLSAMRIIQLHQRHVLGLLQVHLHMGGGGREGVGTAKVGGGQRDLGGGPTLSTQLSKNSRQLKRSLAKEQSSMNCVKSCVRSSCA